MTSLQNLEDIVHIRYRAYSEIGEDVSSRLMSAANSTKYDRDIDCCG
jgi:hypothetical protein